SRTKPSLLAVARDCPSGENASDRTASPCRQRTVPSRATAPSGSGSPAWSPSGFFSWANSGSGTTSRSRQKRVIARPPRGKRDRRIDERRLSMLTGSRWRCTGGALSKGGRDADPHHQPEEAEEVAAEHVAEEMRTKEDAAEADGEDQQAEAGHAPEALTPR